MSGNAPILVRTDGTSSQLRPVDLTGSHTSALEAESLLDDLLFRFPAALPISEIDSAYVDPVPICQQLSTSAGFVDLLFVTPAGRIVLVENKLWRNPEARRKVVGQILDYAAAMAKWSYEDLQREVSKRTQIKGNSLFELVKEKHPLLSEARFVDAVSTSLKRGRFLLLVCGDGIREGTQNIASFLDRFTAMDFSFGLVEIAISEDETGDRFVLPRTLAKPEIISRNLFVVEDGRLVEQSSGASAPEHLDEPQSRNDFQAFWQELADGIEFDDPAQDVFSSARRSFVSLRMPSPKAWITLYFDAGSNQTGIFLVFKQDVAGQRLATSIFEARNSIASELPSNCEWLSEDGRWRIRSRRELLDIKDPAQRAEAKTWLGQTANTFVNAFRHRIAAEVS